MLQVTYDYTLMPPHLSQIFKAKSAEFREAIAAVLGVKLAFYPNGQVRVTSIYDLNASFVFQPGTYILSVLDSIRLAYRKPDSTSLLCRQNVCSSSHAARRIV
jgi:hypothetical protein